MCIRIICDIDSEHLLERALGMSVSAAGDVIDNAQLWNNVLAHRCAFWLVESLPSVFQRSVWRQDRQGTWTIREEASDLYGINSNAQYFFIDCNNMSYTAVFCKWRHVAIVDEPGSDVCGVGDIPRQPAIGFERDRLGLSIVDMQWGSKELVGRRVTSDRFRQSAHGILRNQCVDACLTSIYHPCGTPSNYSINGNNNSE